MVPNCHDLFTAWLMKVQESHFGPFDPIVLQTHCNGGLGGEGDAPLFFPYSCDLGVNCPTIYRSGTVKSNTVNLKFHLI